MSNGLPLKPVYIQHLNIVCRHLNIKTCVGHATVTSQLYKPSGCRDQSENWIFEGQKMNSNIRLEK